MTQPDTYKPGDLVIIDDKFTGEITEHLRSYNGSHMDSWRVEVDSGKERHEHWIIAGDRMDHFVRTPEAAAAACNAAHAAESGDVSGPCALPAPVAERARLAAILTQRAPTNRQDELIYTVSLTGQEIRRLIAALDGRAA